MKRWLMVAGLGLGLISVSLTAASRRAASTGEAMTASAAQFLETLDDSQRAQATMEFASAKRFDWHFIPKAERKGLQIKHMNKAQRAAAHKLLENTLSKVGYEKAVKIMELEKVLAALEEGRQGGNIRDAERYYYTVFGAPAKGERWGLSIEGHHLSFNFVVEGDEVVSSTPTFFAANPATMKSEIAGIAKGTRVLAQEEALGFELVNSLSDELRGKAMIADKAPREIRGAGEKETPADEKAGVSYEELPEAQQRMLRQLVAVYARNMPEDIAMARLQAIVDHGPKNVHFAWAGATKPGVGHYYRIQGPSFLIEFVNTQPDPAGNPANHIHCIWRDTRGDFGETPKAE